MDTAARPFKVCSQCGDVLGVYEPLIIAHGDGRRSTVSLAELQRLELPADPVVVHAACLERRGSADRDAGTAFRAA